MTYAAGAGAQGESAWVASQNYGKVKCPVLAFAWASVWMLRCAEFVQCNWKHVETSSQLEKTVSLTIPISKMDKGMGVKRTLVCCGKATCSRSCAWVLWWRIKDVMKDQQPEDHIFVKRDVKEVKPGFMVGAWKRVLGGALWPLRETFGSYDVRQGRAPAPGGGIPWKMEVQCGADVRRRSAGGSAAEPKDGGPGNYDGGGVQNTFRVAVPEESINAMCSGHALSRTRSRGRMARTSGGLKAKNLRKGRRALGPLHKGQPEKDPTTLDGKGKLGHPIVEMEDNVRMGLRQRESKRGL